jgi:hypothetical protein
MIYLLMNLAITNTKKLLLPPSGGGLGLVFKNANNDDIRNSSDKKFGQAPVSSESGRFSWFLCNSGHRSPRDFLAVQAPSMQGS